MQSPVKEFLKTDFVLLQEEMTVDEAIRAIRERGGGDSIIYYYVADSQGRLCGVLPTRRLLSVGENERIGSIMIRRVVAIPESATLLEACEVFLMHRFFAFPVVDRDRRVLGVVDVGLFTDEVLDIAEREQVDNLFETLGFRLEQVRGAPPLKAFRFRFPWLLATIASGTGCALLTGVYQATLVESLVLAFFLTLVLGLGESVSIQSMTLTIQALRSIQPTPAWFMRRLLQEGLTASLLGVASSLLVGGIVWLWRGDWLAAFAIGASIALALVSACLIGLGVPSFLHATRLDPKIAAGPITLALADLSTIFIYFTMATILFGIFK